ncbi:non-ribosomal peptide synthetase [Brevibacillus dissolubilis]|uniref:non-ribosomal peptide synthetase n=1 Tax=Brevibacillus dissolubilis TaxID=1844116 RepID=UPI001115FF60|nr:non-ribosomal peptide synthetase [Brevibacillus dissolubilis]
MSKPSSKPSNVQKIYPLSPMQEGMLFHVLLEPTSAAYLTQTEMRVRGAIDADLMEQSLNKLIERHEILRTVFVYQQIQHLRQVVLKERKGNILFENITHLPQDEQEAYLANYKQQDRQKGFDLAKDILFRMSILQTGEQTYRILISYHHIIMDGWCQGILFYELLQIYAARLGKQTLQLEPSVPYSHYIDYLKKQDKEEALDFWRHQLSDYSQQATLPQKKKSSAPTEYHQQKHTFTLDQQMTKHLNELAIRCQATLNTLMQAIWATILTTYSNTHDVVFGSVVSGRTPEVAGIEKMIGLTINTIPVRIQSQHPQTFQELVTSLQKQAFESEPYHYVPLYDIQSQTELKQGLFNHLFVFENYPMDVNWFQQAGAVGFTIEDADVGEQTNYDFNLIIVPGEQMSITFNYNALAYEEELVTQIEQHLLRVISAVTAHPGIGLHEIEMITQSEKEQILLDFNHTKAEYPREKTIPELFAEQAERVPDEIAVIFQSEQLTYRELDKRSNQLAHVLRAKGVTRDALVAIMMERSLDMVVAMLAVVKAGGAYVPIDPAYPADRMAYMLEDCQARWILSQQHLVGYLQEPQVVEHSAKAEMILLDEANHDQDYADSLTFINQPNDLAYVIYTSGSTGRPKGVMAEHRGAVRLVKNTNYVDFSQERCILQTGSIVFDACTFEIWGALLNGLSVVLVPEHVMLDAVQVKETIERHQVSVMFITTALFAQLAQQNPETFAGLRTLLVGGEVLVKQQIEQVQQNCPSLHLHNIYGPTENTTFSTYFAMDADVTDPIPIGRPIQHSTAYIVDRHMRLLPVGVAGELCVGGDGLARGYLNNQQLTEDKFVPNPFVPGERMYRTGDLARWRKDGAIEFLGRIDQQVKVRGYRIEPGEIEAQLLSHDAIHEVLVIPKQDASNQTYLCAYLVSDHTWTLAELRAWVGSALPDYMIPAAFVQLEAMPLNINGKIDRKALPEPTGHMQSGTEYTAPRTELEKQLAAIWSELLGVEQVGLHDDFFALGGHSLKATQLVSRIQKQFEVVYPLRDVFTASTLEEMASRIMKLDSSQYVTIERAWRDTYPVTPAQKRVFVMQQLEPDSIHYNIPALLQIEGNLDKERLQGAIQSLVKRHDAFRTYFEKINDEWMQRVLPEAEALVPLIERKADQQGGKDVEQLVRGFIRPFDLSQAPLIRVGLIERSETSHLLIVDMHHIISDGTSLNTFTRELIQLYQGAELPELRLQYTDYAVWLESWLQSEAYQKQESYWLQQFHEETPVLELPTDYTRSLIQQFDGDLLEFELDEAQTKALHQLSAEHGVTLYMTLLTAYYLLLHKYSGQEDIIVGTPVAGRNHADIQQMIGMFVNTLALRSYPDKEKRFSTYVQEVKEMVIRSMEHQDYPLEELLQKLNVKRDVSRNPLFDVLFILQNMDQDAVEMSDVTLTPYSFNPKVAKFDLTLAAVEREGKLFFQLEYSTHLFTLESMQRMVGHFVQIVQEISRNPQARLREINMVTEQEKELLLTRFNDTKGPYPRDLTITELFAEQVERTPDEVAVVYGEEVLTYRQLDERSNRLARLLRRKGVQRDTSVALLVERSTEMVIGMLATMKAGGAYMPIDPTYPADRIQYMLDDSRPPILLSQKAVMDELRAADVISGQLDAEVLLLDDPSLYEESAKRLPCINTATDLANIIYTSGSTGRPKGVMVEHRGVVRLIKNTNYLDLEQEKSVLQTCAIVFDVCTFEVWGALLNGLKLVLVPDHVIMDAELLQEKIDEHDISTMWLTTPLFNQLSLQNIDLFTNLKTLMVGGDAVSRPHMERVKKKFPSLRLINGYGPTENTVFSTTYEIEEPVADPIPIGRPIKQSTAYVLDESLNLLPIGLVGELCVGGDGLARGYLNKAELTAEKFIAHPFIPGERIYRTGDLARLLPDGNIEYLGRMDNQVKIRGYRIELGEIEAQLLKHETIHEVVVMAKRDEQNQTYLCVYLVSDDTWTLPQLRHHMAQTLPEYMLPSAFVQVDKMPLTPNGKINRKALPEPTGIMQSGVEYEAPVNHTEHVLATIWSELLAVERVGRHDHFFDLGGHSLKAIQLVAQIHKQLDVQFPLRDVFVKPTLREMAERIGSLGSHRYQMIEPVSEREVYPVSPAQKRMYVMQELTPASISYNIPFVLTIQGGLDTDRLQSAVQMMVERHEGFRTSFEMVEETLMQRIHPQVELSIEVKQAGEHELEAVVKDFIRPFDLTQAPLIRVGLVEVTGDTDKTTEEGNLTENATADQKHLLLIDMHHIISDGTSIAVFTEELIGFYAGKAGETQPPLRIQYKDYAAWLEGWVQSEAYQKQEQYWLQAFDYELPVLQLPTDYPRPAVRSFEGDRVGLTLDEELTAAIRTFAKETDTTVYMVLLAAYNVLLSKYSGQDDIVVGTPVAGRSHPDVERLIGMFINTLPLRNRPTGQKSLREFVQEVRENAIQAFEHQDYPLEELIEKLGVDRDLSRNPLFDTMFAMPNMERAVVQQDGLTFSPFEYEYRVSKFDLTFEAMEEGEQIALGIEYATKLFKPDTIYRMAEHYQQILRQMTARPEQSIADTQIITEAEGQMLLHDWNQTAREYPRDKTIHQLFAEQAARTPERVAVILGEEQYTYRELDERSSQMAQALCDRGVARDQLVALMVEKSLDMVVGMLAILKAGGAYVPIDPDYPVDRIAYLLEDSQAKWMLCHQATAARLEETALSELTARLDVLLLDDPQCSSKHASVEHAGVSEEAGHAQHTSPTPASPQDLAYVIYTSGSTGRPKGVMVEHRNVVRLVQNTNYVDFSTEKAILQTGATVFDATTFEVWGALLNGLQVVLVPTDIMLDAHQLQQLIEKHGITVMFLTTALFYSLSQQQEEMFAGLSTLLVGGEAMLSQHVEQVRAKFPSLRLVNIYGPTENTTFSTYYDLDGALADPVPIGKPIANTTAYVMDAGQKLLPVGITGELHLGGDGVARGYLNNTDLTREKFVDHPYAPGERLYRTGDLARMLPDGNIEYVGRIDHQVKIRGYRIELGEIEAQLLAHDSITEAVVLAKQDETGTHILCAYLVSDRSWSLSELRAYLAISLPEYMLPAALVQLEQIPLTTNGKVDRKALPEPSGQLHSGVEYAAPEGDVEAQLAELWSGLLGVERVGRNDHFFDLGGHSLRAMQLVTRIQKHFQVEYSLRDVFAQPMLQGMAKQIRAQETRQYTSIEPVDVQDVYPVSPAQRRMYFMQQIEPTAVHYNIPAVLLIEGVVDTEQFRTAVGQMIERHEVFRTSFEMNGDVLMQRVHPVAELPFTVLDAREQGGKLEQTVQDFIRPFDLSKAPLIRIALVVLDAGRYALLVDMHHIISDGTSMSTFTQELIRLYEGEELPSLRIHYKDFAVWHKAWVQSEAYEKQERYWLETFGGSESAKDLPVLQLPTDHPRPAVQSFEGSRLTTDISAGLTQAIRHFAKEHDTTLFTVMLTAYNILLGKYSGQEDIIVGTSTAGRSHADVQGLIGMFINSLALRNQPQGHKTVEQFIREVRDCTLSAFEHQDYPLEELIQKLELRRDMSRNPLFDTMFILQNMERASIKRDSLIFTPYEYEHRVSKFDLTFQATEDDEQVALEIEYSTALFEEATIQRMAGDYVEIMSQMISRPEQTLSAIEVAVEQVGTAAKSGVFDGDSAAAAFWKKELEEYKRLQLPVDKAIQGMETSTNTTVSHSYDTDLLSALEEWAGQNGMTIRSACFAAYLSALRMFVYEDEDLLAGLRLGEIGANEYGRPDDLSEDGTELCGSRLYTLPVRVKHQKGTTWREWVETVHRKVVDVETFGCLPLREIVALFDHSEHLEKDGQALGNQGKAVVPELEPASVDNPFFDTLFDFSDTRILESAERGHLIHQQRKHHDEHTHTMFNVHIHTDTESFGIHIQADTRLTHLSHRFIHYFGRSLQLILQDPDRPIDKQQLMTETELHQLLVEYNQTQASMTRDKTISQLFEQQVQLTPDQTALVFEDEELTYAELNEEANQLARILQQKGVQPNTLVALMAERSVEMVVSILAILKAGGAYLPIDPEYPAERILYMLDNSKASWLLTQREVAMGKLLELAKQEVELAAEVILLDDLILHEEETDDLPCTSTPDDLAYVIYTSGSTGRPKGVMVEHRGIANLQAFFQQQWGVSSQDRIVQFASSSFDASVWETFMALLTGATLYLISRETIHDYRRFGAYMEENGITIATLPPTYAIYLQPEQAPSLRRLITAGSEATQDLVNLWGPHVVYTNAYGPTESTVCATYWEAGGGAGVGASSKTTSETESASKIEIASESESVASTQPLLMKNTVPIGKPITNTQIYIVNADLQPQPAGVPGELCIAGIGLARGYLNNTEMTHDKFVPNPFVTGEKMYRTGDLAMWLPDGQIEFLGRIDNQVKIRGYRIEPGEIEAVLLAHEDISEAVIVPHQDAQGTQHLCAYYVSTSATDLTVPDLRAHVGGQLPAYMIPSYFIRVPQMPLTTSGKIDRKALPQPDGAIKTGRTFVMASNEIEEKLVQLWQELLGVESVGTEDDFFELGGNSMLLLTLQSRIRLVFQEEIPLKTFLTRTTVQAQANMIQEKLSSTSLT